MKSLIQLWTELANEIASICHTSATRDVETLTRRIEDEGDSFLTITLPTFAKDFERSLELQRVDPQLFIGFAKMKRSPLPRFLGGLTSRVFDSESGVLHDNPCIDAVAGIRQLTLAFGKIERSCSDGRVASAFAGYVMTDRMVEEWQNGQVSECPKALTVPAIGVSTSLVITSVCQERTCQFTNLRSPWEDSVTPHLHVAQN